MKFRLNIRQTKNIKFSNASLVDFANMLTKLNMVKQKNKGVPKPLVKLFGVRSVASGKVMSQDAVMRLQERAHVNRRSKRIEKIFQGLRSTGQVVIIHVATISLLVVETSGDTEKGPSLTSADCLLRQSFFCKFFNIIWLQLNKTTSGQRAFFLISSAFFF